MKKIKKTEKKTAKFYKLKLESEQKTVAFFAAQVESNGDSILRAAEEIPKLLKKIARLKANMPKWKKQYDLYVKSLALHETFVARTEELLALTESAERIEKTLSHLNNPIS